MALFPLICALAAIAALGLPVALVHVPPLVDYPNHFARLWLIAGGIRMPPLSAMYTLDWTGALTNIGVDLLAATLGRAIGVERLGPLLVVAALVLPPLGAVLLNRAVFGRWHWWQVGFATLAWNSTLLAGFLSFQIGLGLALLAAAADPVITRRAGPFGAVTIRVGVSAALLVFHVFAATFYAALVAGLVFGPGRTAFRSARSFAHAALKSVMAGGLVLAMPLIIFLAVAPVIPGGHAPSGVFDIWAYYTVGYKVRTVMSAIMTYDIRIDLVFAIALYIMARVVACEPLLRGHAGLLLATLGLLALALLIPRELADTGFVDWRFPIMALLTGVAALQPNLRSPRGAAVAATVLLALALARTAWITDIWRDRQMDIAAVQRALQPVPAGAAVLPVESVAANVMLAPRGRYILEGVPSFWHYAALAVPWRHAFVPTLFTARGKQPLRVLPPWDSIAVAEGRPAPVNSLLSFTPLPKALWAIGYVADWRNRFDYVLVMNSDLPSYQGQASLPPGLELIADEGFARLYKIRHESGVRTSNTDVLVGGTKHASD